MTNRIPRTQRTKLAAQQANDPVSVKRYFSPEEMDAIERALYTRKFYDFIKAFWPVIHQGGTPFKPNWHIEAIADHLQAQTMGQMNRLIINVPPGAGKSICAGVMWTPWEWAFRDPKLAWGAGTQFLATSADLRLAERDNQRTRWILESEKYQHLFPLSMKKDSDSKTKFTNEFYGYRQAVPFTSITGNRGDRLIIDDPIGAEDANSEVERDRVNRMFFESATSRINNPETSTITIIQQRLHMNDLVGNITEKQEDLWNYLILPMEYVPKSYHYCKNNIGFEDPRGEAGELLFPKHWGPRSIEILKNEGPYKYASQYQQDPVPREDGFFSIKDFVRYEPKDLPKHLHYYMTSDHSLGLSNRSDYTVIRVWGIDENKNMWLVDSFRDKAPLKEAMGIETSEGGGGILKISAKKSALRFIQVYQPLCWFPEGDNAFKGIVGLVRETMISNNVFCRIEYASMPTANKQAKASAYQAASQAGKVYLPKGPVGDEALLEYAQFPVGKHDDQVDADAILARMISGAHAAIVPPEPRKKGIGDYGWTDDEEDGRPEGWHLWF